MRVSKICKTGMFTAGMSCLLVAIASAQQTSQGSQPGLVKPGQSDSSSGTPGGQRNVNNNGNIQRNVERQPGGQASGDQSAENQGEQMNYAMAACLLDNNKAEVELSKIAVEHAKNQKVKEFAEQMVEDHGKMVDMLQKFVGAHEPTDRRSQIDHKINEACAASMRKELESKTGTEFDACYVGSQIAGHMHMLAALEVLSDDTSGELQGMVKDAKPKVEKHYAHAKELIEKSDNHQASRASSKDRS